MGPACYPSEVHTLRSLVDQLRVAYRDGGDLGGRANALIDHALATPRLRFANRDLGALAAADHLATNPPHVRLNSAPLCGLRERVQRHQGPDTRPPQRAGN